MQINPIKIFLGINYQTSPGEDVLIVGSIPELGNWNPSKGFPLTYHQVRFHHLINVLRI